MNARSYPLARWVSVGGLTHISLIPNGETWLVKSIVINNRHGSAAQVAITIHGLSIQVASIIYYKTDVPAVFEPTVATTWAVAIPGDQLEIYTNSSDLTIAVYGARLDGVAPPAAAILLDATPHAELALVAS